MKWIVRALLAVVVLLLLALTGLFVASQQEGAASMSGTVTINRPAAEVWPYLVEGDKLKSWVGWLVDVKDEGGPFAAVGARQVWTMEDRNNNNQLMRIAGVAEAMEPPSKLVVRVSAAEGFSGVTRYEMKDLGARTELKASAEYEMKQWFAKLLIPLIMNQARQKFNEDLQRLKTNAEAARP